MSALVDNTSASGSIADFRQSHVGFMSDQFAVKQTVWSNPSCLYYTMHTLVKLLAIEILVATLL